VYYIPGVVHHILLCTVAGEHGVHGPDCFRGRGLKYSIFKLQLI